MDRFSGDRFDDAVKLFELVALGDEFLPFLTTAGYERYLQ
jgi:malate synthase